MRVEILPGKTELARVDDVWIGVVVLWLDADPSHCFRARGTHARESQIYIKPVQHRILLSGREHRLCALRGRIEIVEDMRIVEDPLRRAKAVHALEHGAGIDGHIGGSRLVDSADQREGEA